jgi:hypothetical protein
MPVYPGAQVIDIFCLGCKRSRVQIPAARPIVSQTYKTSTPHNLITWVQFLTLADAHAELAYYFDHMDEIREEIRAERSMVDESRQMNPSLLRARVGQEKVETLS